jgi:hypothetical protein
MTRHATVHVATLALLDPHTGGAVELEIRKDVVSGALVGIDGSYLDQDVGPVRSPYHRNVILDIPDNEMGDSPMGQVSKLRAELVEQGMTPAEAEAATMPPQLTDEQKKKYIERGGNRCPFCDSDDIEGTRGVQTDSGCAWQDIRCCACNAEWQDIYTLTDIDFKP